MPFSNESLSILSYYFLFSQYLSLFLEYVNLLLGYCPEVSLFFELFLIEFVHNMTFVSYFTIFPVL